MQAYSVFYVNSQNAYYDGSNQINLPSFSMPTGAIYSLGQNITWNLFE